MPSGTQRGQQESGYKVTEQGVNYYMVLHPKQDMPEERKWDLQHKAKDPLHSCQNSHNGPGLFPSCLLSVFLLMNDFMFFFMKMGKKETIETDIKSQYTLTLS